MEGDTQTYKHHAISIEKLIAAPFIATANANTRMAREQAKFLIDSCFESDGDAFRPKMVNLSMTKSLPGAGNSEQESLNFELPLITIIPFNSLCVTDMKMRFDLEILAYEQAVPGTDEQGKNKDKCTLHGNVSNDSKESASAQRRRQSKMSVEINGGTIPLPVGLTTLIDLYSKNIKTSKS